MHFKDYSDHLCYNPKSGIGDRFYRQKIFLFEKLWVLIITGFPENSWPKEKKQPENHPVLARRAAGPNQQRDEKLPQVDRRQTAVGPPSPEPPEGRLLVNSSLFILGEPLPRSQTGYRGRGDVVNWFGDSVWYDIGE